MPRPRTGEGKNAYIARFMRATEGESRSRAQRLAIAFSYWRKRKDRLKSYLGSRR